MSRSLIAKGNWLHGIGNRAVRNAVNALSGSGFKNYEIATAAGTSTGLNTPNRVRNSATLAKEPNLFVDVVGGGHTWLIQGKLGLALTAANGIKLDFNAGTATIVANTLGGSVTFWTAGSNTSATAIGATNAVPFRVALTALSTAVDGGTSNTWVGADFWFVAQFAVSGTVQLEFAQSSAGATNTDILPGSFIEAIPMDYYNQSAEREVSG
jgi:hypothetical protein